jgi:hypothetical protein
MALTNTLEYLIRLYDLSTQVTSVRTATISDSTPTAGETRNGTLIDTNEATISLPVTTVRQVFVKNTHATADITVAWTPSGASKISVIKLGPGDGIILWGKNAAASLRGITQLSLTASTAGATYDLMIGG